VRVHRGECMRVYVSVCGTVFLKKKNIRLSLCILYSTTDVQLYSSGSHKSRLWPVPSCPCTPTPQTDARWLPVPFAGISRKYVRVKSPRFDWWGGFIGNGMRLRGRSTDVRIGRRANLKSQGCSTTVLAPGNHA
jgi:hypothetical protein